MDVVLVFFGSDRPLLPDVDPEVDPFLAFVVAGFFGWLACVSPAGFADSLLLADRADASGLDVGFVLGPVAGTGDGLAVAFDLAPDSDVAVAG